MSMIIDGVERFLGNNDAPVSYSWPVYGDAPTAPMIARSQWPELISQLDPGLDHPCLPYVHDQNGRGQCNANATAALIEYIRACMGLPFVQLSAADLYHRINGGGDNGSLLEDGLRECLQNGIGTAATCGTIWQPGMKLASREERARFRGLEAYICPTFDHVMSAALMGFGVVSGVMWYDNYKPDGDGWLPTRGVGRGGGHAVFGYKPAMRHGKFGIGHQNSWTPSWGVQGRGIFPEEMYRGPVGGWWALRQVVAEEMDLPAPRAA